MAPRAASAWSLPAPAREPLRRHVFEDNTASIGLAPGWSTPSRNAMQGVRVLGPAGQSLTIGVSVPVQTPGSMMARMPSAIVAPMSSPAAAFQVVAAQVSRRIAARGGAATRIEGLSVLGDLPGGLRGSRGSLLRFGVSERRPDGSTAHYQAVATVSLAPTSASSYLMFVTEMRAPDASFERDLPVMMQMNASVHENAGEIQRRTRQDLDARGRWFAGQQAAQRAQVAANDRQHAQYWETQRQNERQHREYDARQLQQDRSNDNFHEYLRGTRTVEDTRTGERHSVDYGSSTEIVDRWNERDPDRYREIPLRDELHPLAGQ
jgi:hypothetical protein